MSPSDPLFAQQWQYSLIGNIERIWDEFDGTGVSIAVYDGGLEPTHPDLAANYDASLHFTYEGTTFAPTATPADDAHGTAVAGLIAAVEGNGEGGVGVAFGAQITGVDFLDLFNSADLVFMEAMITWASHFDIMSNSWGFFPNFDAFQDIGDAGSFHDAVESWYGTVVQTGRGGLGTVVVQGAGNDTLNANGDGLSVSRFTVTVAATEEDGFVASYSNYGSAILVAGPAAAVTTDLTGDAGLNTGSDGDLLAVDYTGTFSGTSAATPVVSGVIALMLEAAPGLGWRDVHNILALSAGHTGSAYGGAGSGSEVGQWEVTGASDWNGGGRAVHMSYGYGMVDAFAAVRMAEAWGRMSGAAQTSGNEVTVTAAYGGVASALPDFGSTALAVDVTGNVEIEAIYVTLSIRHSFAEDVVLALRAPDGTEVTILENPGGSSLFDTTFEYTFGNEFFRGYSSLGTWSLVAYDTSASDSGTLLDFDLEFFGRAPDSDDIHSFTDDFLALAALDPGRCLFQDTNGGTDWLNFAGLAQAVTGQIGVGKNILVGGVVWGQVAADVFENVYLTDGNDRLIGGSGNNVMGGARGNDRLNGFLGNDLVEGNVGKDRLVGGGGNDTVDGGVGLDVLTGGKGADLFVFGKVYGGDTILDFEDNRDAVQFDNSLWGGANLTVAEVISTFATVVGTTIVFDFGLPVLTLSFSSAQSTEIFLDDVFIV